MKCLFVVTCDLKQLLLCLFVYFFWSLPNPKASNPVILKEVLQLITAFNKKLLIELKGPFSGLPDGTAMMLKLLGKKQPEYPELPTLVSKVLQPYVKQLEGNIFVQSFHRPYLEELRSLMPELQLVYLTLSSNRSWLQREDLQIPLAFSGVSVRHTALTPDAVKELQKIQGHVFAWTVDSEISLCSMMAAGVDGVITNRPDTAVALLAEGNFSAPKRRRCCRSRAKLA